MEIVLKKLVLLMFCLSLTCPLYAQDTIIKIYVESEQRVSPLITSNLQNTGRSQGIPIALVEQRLEADFVLKLSEERLSNVTGNFNLFTWAVIEKASQSTIASGLSTVFSAPARSTIESIKTYIDRRAFMSMGTKSAFSTEINRPSAAAQQPATSKQASGPRWNHTKLDDPINAKTQDIFTLVGEYVELPPLNRAGDAPKLIVVCSNGKVVNSYGLVAATLWSGGVKIDTRINEKKRTVSGGVVYTKDPVITEDKTGRPYSTFDLSKILSDVLQAKSFYMSVTDDIASSRTREARQVLMQFEMVDPEPLVAACGKDGAFKDIVKGK